MDDLRESLVVGLQRVIFDDDASRAAFLLTDLHYGIAHNTYFVMLTL